MTFLYIVWYGFIIAQSYLAYGTAYRQTKANGDNGVALWGWLIVYNLAALIPGLGIYHWKKSRELEELETYDHNEQRLMQQRKEELDKKDCPFCAEQINKKAAFCEFCGGNVGEWEEEDKKRKREKFEKEGFAILFDDEELMKQANNIKQIHGELTYIDYLKEKAKERGMGDIDLTEEVLGAFGQTR